MQNRQKQQKSQNILLQPQQNKHDHTDHYMFTKPINEAIEETNEWTAHCLCSCFSSYGPQMFTDEKYSD